MPLVFCLRRLRRRLSEPRSAIAFFMVTTALGLSGCQPTPKETAQARAKVGDILVMAEGTTVALAKPFRQGEPNGLFDGVISVKKAGQQTTDLLEVNAICSVPGEAGWPPYDNLYGKAITRAEQAKGRSGDTQWQILYYFSGKQDARMGQKPGPWIDRLHDNLCRHGDFDDRPKRN